MKDILLYKNFSFNIYKFKKHKYTDGRGGSPFHYIAYMIKGHSKIVAEGVSIEIGEGDLFYIPEGLPYQSYWESDDDIRFISLGFHYFPETDDKDFVLQKIECGDDIKQAVADVPISDYVDSKAIGAFYSTLSRIIPHLKSGRRKEGGLTVERAARFIYDNINCKVADIAEHLLVSRSELYLIFKSESDMTPNELIQAVKCKKAQMLLATTDRPVEEISDALGFSSASYFRKVFKKHTGKTPRQIRNLAEM